MAFMSNAIKKLDVNQVRKEVESFVKDPEALKVWSKEFFHEVARRVVLI